MGFYYFSHGFPHFSHGIFPLFPWDFPIIPMGFEGHPPTKIAKLGGSLRGSGEAAGAFAAARPAALQLCVSGHRGRSTLQAFRLGWLGWDAGD